MTTSLIVAAARNDVIGSGGSLPWYLPDDLRRFRRLTTGHPVVVGRLTHESILARLGHPLPGRTSVVISSRVPGGPVPAGVVFVTSLESALSEARAAESEARAAESEARAARGETAQSSTAGEIFVIGGTSVYQQSLPHVDRIYLTRVHREVAGDTSMPANWLAGFRLAGQEDRPAQGTEAAYSWLDYVRETP
jgi:dihydrofolate reductase